MIQKSLNLKIIVLFGAVLFFYSQPVFAFKCPSHRTSTSLKSEIKSVEYVRNVSSKDLTVQQHGENIGLGHVLGLAGGEVGVKFTMDFDAVDVGDKLYCLRAKNIRAKFYAYPKIYIASNFKRGSCEYNKVLKHETEHVTILKRTHRGYVREYKDQLRRASYGIPILQPTKLININDQKDQLVAYVSKILSEYINNISKELAVRQAEIDTPEEYARAYKKCKRWDKKLNEK